MSCVHCSSLASAGARLRKVKLLFRVTALKLRATPLGVRKAELGAGGGRIVFDPEAAIDPQSLVRLVQSDPISYRFDGPEKLRIALELPEAEDRVNALESVLDGLCLRDAA